MPNSSLEDGLKPSARKILAMLRAAGPAGVTTGQFTEAYSARFGARLLELTRAGWRWDKAKVKGQSSYTYFLTAEPIGLRTVAPAAQARPPARASGSAESGGIPAHPTDSDSSTVGGLGGLTVAGGALFDVEEYRVRPGYADVEVAA